MDLFVELFMTHIIVENNRAISQHLTARVGQSPTDITATAVPVLLRVNPKAWVYVLPRRTLAA